MIIDEENISNKSSIKTLFLCLVFGQLGAHRFYVGKYITGLLYLVIGCTSVVFDILGFGYGFIAKIIYLIFLAIDLYALYSDSFTDSKGRLIMDHSKTIKYENLQEREKILFLQRTDKELCFLTAVLFYLSYYLVMYFIF